MSYRYFSIIFPDHMIKEPVIYSLVSYYEVEPNIYRASVSGSHSWMVVSLSGPDDRIDRAVMDLKRRGATIKEGDKGLLDEQKPPSVNAIRVRLKVPKGEVDKPFISDTIKAFDVVMNIRTANIGTTEATIEMELSGPLEAIDKAVDFMKGRGISVAPIEGNVIE